MRAHASALLLTLAFVSAVPARSSATHPQTPATTETASQFYLRFRNVVMTAKSVDEITAFWTTDTKNEFNMEPESAKADTLPMAKRFYGMQTGVKVVKETATPTGATLSLEGVDQNKLPIVSSVDVVKENGAWRMTAAVEQWHAKPR